MPLGGAPPGPPRSAPNAGPSAPGKNGMPLSPVASKVFELALNPAGTVAKACANASELTRVVVTSEHAASASAVAATPAAMRCFLDPDIALSTEVLVSVRRNGRRGRCSLKEHPAPREPLLL